MKEAQNKEATAPTLHELIRALGNRTNIIPEAHKLLTERGHTYTKSAIYTTVDKNGSNNAVIETALLDAIEAERAKLTKTTARRRGLATT